MSETYNKLVSHLPGGERDDDASEEMEPANLFDPEIRADKEAMAKSLMAGHRRAQMILDERMEEAKTYEAYLDGYFPESMDQTLDDSQFSLCHYPLHFLLESALLPTLVARYPAFMLEISSKMTEVDTGRRELLGKLLDKVWEKYDCQQRLRRTVRETMRKGMAAWEFDLDPEQKCCRARDLKTDQVLVDPDGGTDDESLRWVCRNETMPLAEAKMHWPDADWDKYPVPESGPTDLEKVPEEGKELGSNRPGAEQVRMVKVAVFYVRGDVPLLGDANIRSKANSGKHGKNEVLVCTIEDEPMVLECRPWAFALPIGEWPIEFMRFTSCDIFHPHPIYRPGHSLQEQASWAMTYLSSTLRLASQRKVLVNTTHFATEQMEQLESARNLEIIEVEDQAAFAAVKVLNFLEGLDSQLIQHAQIAATTYKEIMGVNEIIREVKSHTTARDVDAQTQRADQRLGFFVAQVERFISRSARKLLMIAFSTMTADDVKAILGEEMVPGNTEQDEKSGKVRWISPFWQEEMTAEEIRREANMKLEPDSVRHVSKDQKVQELGMFMDRFFGTVSQLTASGVQFQPTELGKVAFAFLSRMAKESGINNVEELIPNMDKLIMPPMPQMPGTEGQPTPAPAQDQGEGASPAGLPPQGA